MMVRSSRLCIGQQDTVKSTEVCCAKNGLRLGSIAPPARGSRHKYDSCLLSTPPALQTLCVRTQSALDSQPKSTVGTPAYIAPEVLQRKE
jgi:serine/threonine protein kinase